MEYNQFLLKVQTEIEKQLGDGFHVRVQRILKNNDTALEGLVISKGKGHLSPTIYLNPYFDEFQQGMEMQEIIGRLLRVYEQNVNISFGNATVEELVDFNNLRDKVAYKLIHRASNQELLKEVPYVEFLDLAVVFYLFLGECRSGQMTALIFNTHMVSWGTTKEELFQLAKKNTPELFPARIRNMKDSIEELLKVELEDFGDAGILDELLGEDQFPFYVLTNQRMMNGACCILYENFLEGFAREQGADLIILPSSIHETLLIPDQGENSYEELGAMVNDINQSEVPEEERLTNQVYRYSRSSGTIEIIFKSEACLNNRKSEKISLV
nr:DUF5688 family protein [uncultured Clostridium sp.]